MSLQKMFATDPSREERGVAVLYTNFRITLARAGGANRKYQRELEALLKPHRMALVRGVFPVDQLEPIYREVYANSVVLNWETKRIQEDGSEIWVQGIEMEDGAELTPFSAAAVLAAFNRYPELYPDVKEQASNIQLYRAAVQEAVEGN